MSGWAKMWGGGARELGCLTVESTANAPHVIDPVEKLDHHLFCHKSPLMLKVYSLSSPPRTYIVLRGMEASLGTPLASTGRFNNPHARDY